MTNGLDCDCCPIPAPPIEPYTSDAIDGDLIIRTTTSVGTRDAQLGHVFVAGRRPLSAARTELAAELRRIANEVEAGQHEQRD